MARKSTGKQFNKKTRMNGHGALIAAAVFFVCPCLSEAGETPAENSLIRLSGRLPEQAIKVEVLDLDGNGSDEIISLLPSAIHIAPFHRDGPAVFQAIGKQEQAVTFSASPGTGLLALDSMIEGAGLQSALLHYENGLLKPMGTGINLWLAFMDSDAGRGMLFGQSFTPETLYGERIFHLDILDGKIGYRESRPANFPPGTSIFGSVWTDLDGDGIHEVFAITIDGNVTIFKNGGAVWSRRLNAPGTPGPIPILPLSRARGMVLAEPSERKTILHCRWDGSDYRMEETGMKYDGEIVGISERNEGLIIAVGRTAKDGTPGETLLYSSGIPR